MGTCEAGCRAHIAHILSSGKEHTVSLHGWNHANTHCSAVPLTATQALLPHWQRIPSLATTIKQSRAACFCPWKVYLHCQRNHVCTPPPPPPHTLTLPAGSLYASWVAHTALVYFAQKQRQNEMAGKQFYSQWPKPEPRNV